MNVLKKADLIVEATPIDTETVFFEFQIACSVHMDAQRKVFKLYIKAIRLKVDQIHIIK